MPTVLIAAFRAGKAQGRAMLTLGALYAVGFMTALGASWLVDGGDFARVYLGGGMPTQEMLMESNLQSAMWVFIGLHLPLSLLFWHAPALVHWHGMSPAKSLFFSIVACVRNFWAMTVFALTSLAALLGNAGLAGTLLFPALMLMVSMFFTSLYFTFRDSFELPSETETAPS